MNFLVKAFCSLLKWLWQSSASPFLLPQWGDWWWQLCVGDELVELYCSSSAVLLGCSAAGAVVRCPLGHSAGLFWEKGSLTARWQLLAETVMVLWVEAQLSAPPPYFSLLHYWWPPAQPCGLHPMHNPCFSSELEAPCEHVRAHPSPGCVCRPNKTA